MYVHKVFHRSFCVMAIVIYALHENTCVYEDQVESFFKDL
jgi:hypothetical protein